MKSTFSLLMLIALCLVTGFKRDYAHEYWRVGDERRCDNDRIPKPETRLSSDFAKRKIHAPTVLLCEVGSALFFA